MGSLVLDLVDRHFGFFLYSPFETHWLCVARYAAFGGLGGLGLAIVLANEARCVGCVCGVGGRGIGVGSGGQWRGVKVHAKTILGRCGTGVGLRLARG